MAAVVFTGYAFAGLADFSAFFMERESFFRTGKEARKVVSFKWYVRSRD